jgi:nucleoid DNA-binding protein
MRKRDLARAIARKDGIRSGEAADQLDKAVAEIVKALRHGEPARLPGIGVLRPGKPWTFKPEQHGR